MIFLLFYKHDEMHNFDDESLVLHWITLSNANHFQDAAAKLVARAKEAIFATYHGYGITNVQETGEEDDGEYEIQSVVVVAC